MQEEVLPTRPPICRCCPPLPRFPHIHAYTHTPHTSHTHTTPIPAAPAHRPAGILEAHDQSAQQAGHKRRHSSLIHLRQPGMCMYVLCVWCGVPHGGAGLKGRGPQLGGREADRDVQLASGGQ